MYMVQTLERRRKYIGVIFSDKHTPLVGRLRSIISVRDSLE